MIIISDAFGNVQSIIPDKIYQGSNNANEIYYIAPFSASNVVTITFELPVSINGLPIEYIMKNPTKISNDHNIWRTKIELPVTQYYGSVKYQIKVTNQTGEIVAISRSTFEVIRGVDIVLPEQPSEDVYQQLLSALSQVYNEANNKVDVLFENKIESQKQTILNDSNEISLNIECVEFTFKFENIKTAVAYESYIDAGDNKYKISINNNIYTIQVNNSNDIITLISDSELTYESYIDSNENHLIEIDNETFLIKQSTKILESGKKLIISKHGVYIDEKSDDKKILLPNEIQEKINNLIENHNKNSGAHQDIRDLISTIQTSSNYLRVGEITTEKISPELDAEIYIENVINPDDNLVQTNFTFKLPSGGTAVKVGGEIQSSINVVQETGESTKDVMSQNAVSNIINNTTLIKNSDGGFAGGLRASAGGGGAVGGGATASVGGAVGVRASATVGGAIGADAVATSGGAVGVYASTDFGGAVGQSAKAGMGFAGGYLAKAVDSDGNGIDAVQLGRGTNNTRHSLQVYDDNIYNADIHTLAVQNATVGGKSTPVIETVWSGTFSNTADNSITISNYSNYDYFVLYGNVSGRFCVIMPNVNGIYGFTKKSENSVSIYIYEFNLTDGVLVWGNTGFYSSDSGSFAYNDRTDTGYYNIYKIEGVKICK